jgi:REP element-mobilizing transposase RayT
MTTNSLPERRRLFHTPPPWVKSGELFFVTVCCLHRGTNSLAMDSVFPVLATAVDEYVHREKWWCHLFLAMPDHVHALFAFSASEQMAATVRNWKRFTAKAGGIEWQDGFFDHRLRNDESFEQKAYYIRMNPVRAGLVKSPERWPYVWPAASAPATAR